MSFDPSEPVSCPACDGKRLSCAGALPPLLPMFGGETLGEQLPSGRLYHCRTCDLRFRHPFVDQHRLTQLYEGLPGSVWAHKDERPAWRHIKSMLERCPSNQAILDVGCFTGDLLAWLPKRWGKYGIEPNEAARHVCRERGIHILGNSLEDVARVDVAFGAITVIDVIEHLYRPLDALRKLQSWLAPGGTIVLLTGAADTWAWRMFGRHFWYSSLPEHVTFYTLRWFRWAARQLGMRVRSHLYLSSIDSPPQDWLRQLAKQAVYAGVHGALDLGVPASAITRLPLVGRAVRWRTVPWWNQARDHILVALTNAPP